MSFSANELDIIRDFYLVACDYIQMIESTPLSYNTVDFYVGTLMKLYTHGLQLPPLNMVFEENTDISEEERDALYDKEWVEWNQKQIKIHQNRIDGNTSLKVTNDCPNYYHQYLNSFDKKSENEFSVAWDLQEIYDELKEGIELFDQGDINSANTIWYIGLDDHWGRHLIQVLSPLHFIRSFNDQQKEDFEEIRGLVI